jgi:hypothetical protein
MLALIPTFALTAGVGPAGAQPEPPRFELVPRVGVLWPIVDLGKARDLATLEQIRAELGIGFAAGLAVQYNPAYLPVSFRVVADYAPFNLTTTGKWLKCEVLPALPCDEVDLDARYLVLSADAVIRSGEYERTSFYLVAGLGIKWYDFAEMVCDAEDTVCVLLDAFARDQVDPMVHLGLGFTFRMGPARLELEVADYMSTYRAESEDASGAVQQDFLATLGLRLGVP